MMTIKTGNQLKIRSVAYNNESIQAHCASGISSCQRPLKGRAMAIEIGDRGRLEIVGEEFFLKRFRVSALVIGTPLSVF